VFCVLCFVGVFFWFFLFVFFCFLVSWFIEARAVGGETLAAGERMYDALQAAAEIMASGVPDAQSKALVHMDEATASIEGAILAQVRLCHLFR
jgi:hypothetical protein